MEKEILNAIGIAGPLFLWMASLIGYKYICSEEDMYLLGLARYTKMDRLSIGLEYATLFLSLVLLFLFMYILIAFDEQVNKLLKNLSFYLFFVIMMYILVNSQLNKYREYKRQEKSIEIRGHKIELKYIRYPIYFAGIIVVCGPIITVFLSETEFHEIINQPSWNLIIFLLLYFIPAFLLSILAAKMDAITCSCPWRVRLIIDKKKIENMEEWKRIKGVRVTGNSIEGIFSKETDDQYILYIEEPERNIFVNKAYVIALIDMFENGDLEQPGQLKEGKDQNKLTEEK